MGDRAWVADDGGGGGAAAAVALTRTPIRSHCRAEVWLEMRRDIRAEEIHECLTWRYDY